jgi:DnaA family protein
MLQLPLDIQLDGSARLDNFYPGNNLQLLQRLKNLDQLKGDFIFIWGSLDVGKSHLAQAVCRHYSEKNLTAAYIPLDNNALVPEVLQGLEFADIVCLDSLQSAAEDPAWQQAIFNLFNNLKNHHRQFIVFSQQSPQNISIQLADLKSRFNSMEVYKLDALTDQQRIGFVISNAQYRGLEISLDVAQFILARASRGVNELISIIDLLDTQSIAQQRKVTIPFVKKVLHL